MDRQPTYHPQSSLLQRAVALFWAYVLGGLHALFPEGTCDETLNANALAQEYQTGRVDRDALRREVEARNARSPLFRLFEVAKRQRWARAEWERTRMGSKSWLMRGFGTFCAFMILLFASNIIIGPHSLLGMVVRYLERLF